MIIERIHGLQATGISLNDRFTILAATAPTLRVPRPRQRRASNGGFININNQNVIDRLVNQIGQQNKRKAIRQRLGMPGLRRFGSESSLPGLRRSNSLSNLSQRSVKNQPSWRQSNNNLNRSASFSSLAQGIWRGRGFRRRGGLMGLMRGRMRGRGGRQQLVWRVWGGARERGGALRGVAGVGRGGRGVTGMARGGRGGGRGAARGRESVTAAGAASRQTKPVPSKEELDLQLDQYMASTKSALDKELDAYMNNAMDLE